MKTNQTPQDIEEMEFDTITLAGRRAGKAYRPVNPKATLLACKANEEQPMKPGKISQFLAACKAYFSNEEGAQYPVSVDVADDIDNDGDGAEDYNAICSAIFRVAGDISAACAISDDQSRANAVKTAIDGFLDELDAFCESNDEAMKAAGKYGDVAYADEKNKKYPIDTEEHARAAWSYINQEKNAAEYSAEEISAIKARIKAACKKFGIEITDDAKKGEGDETMTEEQKAAFKAELEADLTAKVEAAVKAAHEEAVKPLNEKIEAQAAEIEAATKAAEEAKSAAEQATADAQAVKAESEKAVADALAAQKAAEDALSDAITKARGRKAAGGHDEGAQVDNKVAFRELVDKNPRAPIADAVRVLMQGAPLQPR